MLPTETIFNHRAETASASFAAVFVLLCTHAQDFFFLISQAKEQPLISGILLHSFQVHMHTCLNVCQEKMLPGY